MFRQSEATGSGIVVGINNVAQGQGVGYETKVKPRLRVNRYWVAYWDVRDRKKVCGHDRRLGKCSGRFWKHPHMIRVREVLKNPGHTPASENSGSC